MGQSLASHKARGGSEAQKESEILIQIFREN